MKRVRSSKVAALFGFVALALSLAAGFASANERQCVGKFTLTSEIRWGKALLPPGNYSFELDLNNDLITVRGQKQTVMIMSQVHDTDTRLQSRALVLVSRRGKSTVRALQLAGQKVVLLYAVPKENREELARGPKIIYRVPVTLGGN